MTGTIHLKSGRERSVLNRHPWVFQGAVQRITGNVAEDDLVAVRDSAGQFLAWGTFNPQSQIMVRLVSWEPDETIDESFWLARFERAVAGRGGLARDSDRTSAYRLAHAEADGIPGLIVDRYGDWLVVQLLTLGAERRRDLWIELLTSVVPGIRGIVERSDVDVRLKEELLPAVGLLWGDEPPPGLRIVENGLQFQVDLMAGHKTGFYLDQRDNRRLVESYAAGADVLNCFAYTGAFAVYAARGQAARVVNVETSAEALVLSERNLALNGFERLAIEQINADVFKQLRAFRDSGRQFDLVVLDPPKFAHSQGQVKRAARGYKDINWLAMRLLRPGGTLFSFSCSGAVSADLFQKILFGAALDSGREVQVIGRMGQGEDHPTLLTFPESEYLKGLICRVW